ncbi:MAG: FixG Ig-like domain-containing protein, partial [Pseudomonadota bacterium]
CIACAACIDACDSVMDKMGYERGLVRYTTHNAVHGDQTRVLRPRVIVYATLLTILTGGLITAMATRTPIILDVIRDRNQLYRELPGNMFENIYTIKVINQRNEPRVFRLSVDGPDGIVLDGAPDTITVEGGGVYSLPVRVRSSKDRTPGVNTIDFTVVDLDSEESRVEDSRLIGPLP